MPDDHEKHYSVCPHDCPSTCALEIEKIDAHHIGRVYGAKDNSYTDGVICEKVARYAERAHHPDRLTTPLKRTGDKGSNDFTPISWEDALDEVAEGLLKAEQRNGAESVWPYYYAGTMGLLMRDGINRLRHTKGYSGQHSTICTTPAWQGFMAGTGKIMGPDPREMAKSDLVVIWGTNPVNTQINVMTHAVKARKNNGAKVVIIDTYKTGSAKQADLFLCVKPGTDGALACAVMHVLFRDGLADRAYMEKYADHPQEFEAHLQSKTPHWASQICGLSVEEIEIFAHMIGNTPKTFFRLGYGFTRGRNGAVNMHAASCIATVSGAWQYEGGGAFHNNGGIYNWNKTLIEGLDKRDPDVRVLDQSRIGDVLCGDAEALSHGPSVDALFIQNTNPMSVAPDLSKVHKGFARDDLFVCTHEQFMTETAKMSDIVLPATMFVEHDDIYQGGGHQHIIFGPKIIEGPDGCKNNHEVICALAERLGAEHPGFNMPEREIIDVTLRVSRRGSLAKLEEQKWIDCQPDFDEAHYIGGFNFPDGKFRFKPDWQGCEAKGHVSKERLNAMPEFPDHWDVIDNATAEKPFRLVTAPARTFLNTTFNETPSSQKREGRPTVMIHPDDAKLIEVADGQAIEMGNDRGSISLHVEIFEGLQQGVVISEGIYANEAFDKGMGINVLIGAEPITPGGGAVFHDTSVWIKPK